MLSTVGSLVERLRTEMGISQSELARRAEVPRETINRLESGKVKLPTMEVRRKLTRVLGVSQLELLVTAGELDQEVVDQLRGGQDPDAGHLLRAEVVRRIRLLDDRQLREVRRYLDFVTSSDSAVPSRDLPDSSLTANRKEEVGENSLA